MASEVIAEFNSEPGYRTAWHTHDAVMMLAPARGMFTVTDETGGERSRNVPPGAFYWIDAHCGHSSSCAGLSEQLHWVCYAPSDVLHGPPRGARSGILALSRAGERLMALRRLLAEDSSVAASAELENGVSALLWRECAARIGDREGAMRMLRGARLVERVDAELRTHLNEHPQLDTIARVCGVSRRHLTRLYRRETGRSIHAQLNALRMQRAAVLLATSELTVLRVAGEVGFENPSHFARAFRDWYGILPSGFRRRAH